MKALVKWVWCCCRPACHVISKYIAMLRYVHCARRRADHAIPRSQSESLMIELITNDLYATVFSICCKHWQSNCHDIIVQFHCNCVECFQC